MKIFFFFFISSLSLAHSIMEVGGSVQILIPNVLPDLRRTVPSYGPMLGIPVGQTDRIEFQALYGSTEGTSLFLAESAYRMQFPTPFLSTIAFAGLSYLHYGANQNDYNKLAPVIGAGFYFPMTKNFYIAMRMKLYYPEKSLLNFGGQFCYLLD